MADLAFPDTQNGPLGSTQPGRNSPSEVQVVRELPIPEILVGLRPFVVARASVPEAPVYEHGDARGLVGDVRSSRDSGPVKPEAKAKPVQLSPKRYLRFGVLAADAAHDAATRGAVEHVWHGAPARKGQLALAEQSQQVR